MKNDRLFQILYTLLAKGATTAPALAERLGVSVRTVYRDVDALAVSGIPIYTVAGKGGGIALAAGYTFNRAMFTDEEQNQILFALQSLNAADRPSDTLLDKLNGMFQRQSMNWIEVDFSRWGYQRVDHKRFELLKTAVLEKYVLDIVYCSMTGEVSERMIKPFKLIFKSKGWYTHAFCMKANDYRLFKVNRMLRINISQQHFSESFLDAPPLETDEMSEQPQHPVKLLFEPEIAYRVYDEFDRSGITKQPDGALLVQTYLPSDESILGYLLTFGTMVRILEPISLQQSIAAQAQKIAELYRT